MKNTTIAGLLLLCVLGTATAATFIRSHGVAPATNSPRDQTREAPADRQRQEPTILRAYPEGRQSPFLLPRFYHEKTEGTAPTL